MSLVTLMNIDDYFIFESNIAYGVKDFPHGLSFKDLVDIRDRVFARHLIHCDPAIRQSWETRTHLSRSWDNANAVEVIASELADLLRPLPHFKKTGIGLYHGHTLVLTADFATIEEADMKMPWFYKGFTVKCLPIPQKQ
jgi:hypothetical protein